MTDVFVLFGWGFLHLYEPQFSVKLVGGGERGGCLGDLNRTMISSFVKS